MSDRKCSYCGAYYDDNTGHNYDICVQDCQEYLQQAKLTFDNCKWALEKAKEVQAQDWWRKKVKE